MSARSMALAGLVAASALAVTGCKDERATTARSIQGLSPQTVALMTEKGMTKSDPILMRIYKEESKAEIWKQRKSDGKYALMKSYDICRFSGKLGPKIKEGDKQAPEGFYSVAPAQMNPRSSYYLSFNLGFPNAYDRALGRTGQHLMVHGDCLSAGCYAMTNAQIAEIYALARESFNGGQKAFQVQALPFRMTPENIARRRNDKNIAFWKNLKQGSDHFEVTKLEPKVDACGKKYVFNASTGPASFFEPTAGCPSYQVEPTIAKAVAAKQRTDDIVIAQLSKALEPAPEYIAQDGRRRRSLDEPIIQVATVAPPAPAFVAETGELGAGGPLVTASVAKAQALPAAGAPQTAAAQPAAQPAMKPEGRLFAHLFRGDAPAATPAASAAPAVVAASTAKPGRREIAVQQAPVMASSVAPRPEAASSSRFGFGIGGWVRSVGGLFGGSSEPAPAAEPTVLTPPSPEQPAPRARDRSAGLPDAFRPAPKLDPRTTSAFAAFE